MRLAWGTKVSDGFRTKVVQACQYLLIDDPSWLMACMAFETGESFSPSVHNAAGSGAVGLIQFMPGTAAALGTTTEELIAMTSEQQLTYVRLYFEPWHGKLKSLGDVYGAILWPSMIGKPPEFVVFDQGDVAHPKCYLQNKGLDTDHNGKITKAEVVAKVEAKLARGLQPPFVFSNEDLVA